MSMPAAMATCTTSLGGADASAAGFWRTAPPLTVRVPPAAKIPTPSASGRWGRMRSPGCRPRRCAGGSWCGLLVEDAPALDVAVEGAAGVVGGDGVDEGQVAGIVDAACGGRRSRTGTGRWDRPNARWAPVVMGSARLAVMAAWETVTVAPAEPSAAGGTAMPPPSVVASAYPSPQIVAQRPLAVVTPPLMSSGSYFPPPVLAMETPRAGRQSEDARSADGRGPDRSRTVVHGYPQPGVAPILQPDSWRYRSGGRRFGDAHRRGGYAGIPRASIAASQNTGS
jgi:hypothetical protein